MKLCSTFAAKLLLSLSLAIGTASVYEGLEWHRSAASLQSRVLVAKEAEARSRATTIELAAVLPGGESALHLERALSELVLALNKAQLEHRVVLGAMTPAIGGSVSSTADLDSISQSVANTALRVITIQVKGTYREYSGLRSYLANVRKQPAAMSRLVITGNSFEFELKVYGVLA